MSATDAGRRLHYREFYAGELPREPLLLVVGNCQAESVRLLLDPLGRATVRVPPVFELDAADVVRLHGLLRHADALVAQPVGAGYRGHELGTDQLRARLPDAARCVVMPIIRHLALHPYQVVHHPPDGTAPPPVVPYHDLRVLQAALGGPPDGVVPDLTPAMVRAVSRASVAEVRRREQATDVVVSDLLEHPEADDLRTINHPGDRLLLGLARRVADRLGRRAPAAPTRPLLDDVRAPVEPVVARTWGFDLAPGSRSWRLGGRSIDPADVAVRHRRWYAEHPEVARSAWQASAERADLLSLRLDDA